jgi:hypothetical protein
MKDPWLSSLANNVSWWTKLDFGWIKCNIDVGFFVEIGETLWHVAFGTT